MRAALDEMRRALRLAWGYAPVAMVLATFLSLLTAVSTAASAAVQRALVDSVGQASLGRIVVLALLAGLVFTTWLVLQRLGVNLWSIVNDRTVPELRARTLALIDGRAEFESITDPAFLDDVERLRKTPHVPIDLPWVVLSATRTLIGLGLSVALLISVDWRLSVIVLGALASLAVSLLASRKEIREIELLTLLERNERYLHEICVEPRGVEEIRSYDCGPSLSSAAAALRVDIAARRFRTQLRALSWVGASWIVLGVTLVIGLLTVADGVPTGEHTVGDLVLVITLSIALRGQLAGTLETVKSVAPLWSAMQALVRLRGRVGERRPPAAARRELREGISLDGVEFAYARSDAPVLADVDMRLERGSLIAIVGENGAGKTTLANLLLGLLEPTRGRFLVDGGEVDPAAWRQRTSEAFQDFMKPRFTVREAVGIGEPARIDDRDAIQAAIVVGNAGDFVASLPDGIDTSLAPRQGTDLSHGQWQLIALARSRMREAPLLLVLDEPTSALDAHAEFELFQSFAAAAREAAAARGAISVMISHRYSAAYLADRILVVDEGQIIEQGSHAELMALNGRYREMFDLQRIAYLGS
ncbi:MAG: ABC transporter ATP-binding protein [Tessaracoccus sp.]|uniref:ATP-binding cassette domain-containing protein n=1 Tax=Tessaracoccus sp. TaxID=1971211 RepID=UPI001EC056CD|nr:ABC transporter ATP-binding protein [Tessaracoccus sp.]MBK7820824.1 ABC transporter ATP-binding protein [Tessaracoccus sp.]